MKLTPKEELARTKVCLALDGLETLEAITYFIREFRQVVGLFKVGKQAVTKFGLGPVKIVQSFGVDVFLDLKYHDIPKTVEGAACAAAELGVQMFTVHTSGGKEMMEAAVYGANLGAQKYGKKVPKILGVTVLTSIDRNMLNKELRVRGTVGWHVRHLAELSRNAGLDGIVCSALDLPSITPHLPDDFMYVTPGIKCPNTEAGYDQKRVATPGNALNWGSSILVVGRAITDHDTPEDRLQAGHTILKDMAEYM